MIFAKKKTKQVGLALVAALVLTSTAALAKHHHGHGDGGADEGAMPTAGDAGPGHAMADDDETADDDASAPPAVERTPEQAARREQVLTKEHALVASLAQKGGGHLSMRARQAIGMHWRYVMRLSRIRELAEQDKDTASVSKVDSLLERADATFTTKMGEVSADGGAQ